jgi:hypothetical protein
VCFSLPSLSLFFSFSESCFQKKRNHGFLATSIVMFAGASPRTPHGSRKEERSGFTPTTQARLLEM